MKQQIVVYKKWSLNKDMEGVNINQDSFTIRISFSNFHSAVAIELTHMH